MGESISGASRFPITDGMIGKTYRLKNAEFTTELGEPGSELRKKTQQVDFSGNSGRGNPGHRISTLKIDGFDRSNGATIVLENGDTENPMIGRRVDGAKAPATFYSNEQNSRWETVWTKENSADPKSSNIWQYKVVDEARAEDGSVKSFALDPIIYNNGQETIDRSAKPPVLHFEVVEKK